MVQPLNTPRPGAPTVRTPPSGDNSLSVVNSQWVNEAIAGSAPPPSGGGTPIDWPPDQGFLGWTFPFQYASGTEDILGPNGRLGVHLCKAVEAGSIGHIGTYHQDAGSGPVTDENFLALYVVSGLDLVLVAQSAPGVYDADIATAGAVLVPLAVPYVATAGELLYVGSLVNASAAPKLCYASIGAPAPPVSFAGFPWVAPLLLYTGATGFTTPPASVVTSSLTNSIGTPAWYALAP